MALRMRYGKLKIRNIKENKKIMYTCESDDSDDKETDGDKGSCLTSPSKLCFKTLSGKTPK